MKYRTITGLIILSTIVFYLGWDVFVYIRDGNSATESAVTLTTVLHLPQVSFLVGLLCGHLFFPQTQAVMDYVKQRLGQKA